VMRRHGDAWHEESLRVLEPACGSGRLMEALARRGHRVHPPSARAVLDHRRNQ
jgi:2-polyprenyl-3-methyl-5-hydroxy-6-metoxy-1,4-benzoquinol methylase